MGRPSYGLRVPASSARAAAGSISFDAPVRRVASSTILRLPADASGRLPSRGQVAVTGTLNGHGFEAVLEPDGRFGHWMRLDERLRRAAAVTVGETVHLAIAPASEWPEPAVPGDLDQALADAPEKIRRLWTSITPMARWEWVRWVNATRNPDTRRRRVEVTISKMSSGKRRPCCFDLSACTDPELSRSGKLMAETPTE